MLRLLQLPHEHGGPRYPQEPLVLSATISYNLLVATHVLRSHPEHSTIHAWPRRPAKIPQVLRNGTRVRRPAPFEVGRPVGGFMLYMYGRINGASGENGSVEQEHE